MRKILGFFVTLAIASSVYAAPPTVESIDKLLAVTNAQKMIDSMYATMEPMMRSVMAETAKGKTLSAEQQRAMDAFPAAMSKAMREELNWEKLRPLYVQIYQESFTQEELDGLVAFYQSPAGAAMINKMPLVMQKSMNAMQSRLGPLMQKMQKAAEDALNESKAAK